MIAEITLQHWLGESWNRSIGSGLSESDVPNDFKLDPSALTAKLEQYEHLITIIQSQVLPLFNQLMGGTNSRLILSDNMGYILKHWGLKKYSDKFTNIALDTGVNWHEKYKGTNGIGTALATQQAVSIIGDQHFLHQNRFMSCSACPIFNPDGVMIAALDITSEQFKHSPETLMFISSLAQHVETALLCHLPNSHYRVDLAPEPQLINSGLQGIVVADDHGIILGSNPMAKQLISEVRVGDPLEKHFGNSWNQQGRINHYHNLHLQTQSLSPQPGVLDPLVKTLNVSENQDRFREQAKKVLDKQIPLLIKGEIGVGKELFVRQLHADSNRHQQPLVVVNCTTLPADSMESELFGCAHDCVSEGKICQADGGILFLDEIDKLSLVTQGRLLRLLQDQEVVPIDSDVGRKVDVHLVVASHNDLTELVKNGAFRQDLYYRINGFQITLPPLKECGDIEPLIHKLHCKYSTTEQQISAALIARMKEYQWPGNLRELDNMMQIACLMSEGEAELNKQHLPDDMQKLLYPPELVIQSSTKNKIQLIVNDKELVDENLSPLKQRINEDVLAMYQRCGGNISQCAKRLGISRNTLYRKLKVLGLKN